jgi:hypothetical protein
MFKNVFIVSIALMTIACENSNENNNDKQQATGRAGTFGFDVQFLSNYDTGVVQLNNGRSSVLVSPKYQSKVFTSTADGDEGKSFGWINYKAFSAPADPHMNAFGGENRFWLGPEGGKYSLYFSKGDSMVFDNWKTPAPIDTEAWEVIRKDDRSVTMKKDMSITNYAGTSLSMQAVRSVSIQDKNAIEKELSVKLDDAVNYVGYSTSNVLTNKGNEDWNEKTGMPCIWILDMFNPSDSTTIIIPHKAADKNKKVATTDYFGEIGKDRIAYSDNTVYFKADGRSRGKLGILPQYVKPVAGSFDAENNILTITTFSVSNDAKYLNQEWNTSKPAFSGDAMNAYNDGPLTDGSQMGPFYEIESVSPAAMLAAGESLEHHHNVYHFTGKREQLDKIATQVLGVSLSKIQQSFK